MYRSCLPIFALFSAGCFSIEAQAPRAPFTEKDLDLGKQLVATAAEIRARLIEWGLAILAHVQVTPPPGVGATFGRGWIESTSAGL